MRDYFASPDKGCRKGNAPCDALSLFISAPKFSRESFCSKASPVSSLNITLTDKRMINRVHKVSGACKVHEGEEGKGDPDRKAGLLHLPRKLLDYISCYFTRDICFK